MESGLKIVMFRDAKSVMYLWRRAMAVIRWTALNAALVGVGSADRKQLMHISYHLIPLDVLVS